MIVDCEQPCCDDDDDGICDDVDSCPDDPVNDQNNDGYCDADECVDEWSQWSDCTNGQYVTTRTYTIIVDAADCECADGTVQQKDCPTTTTTTTSYDGINRDCQGEWSDWSMCSHESRWRHYEILVTALGD